MDLFDNAIPEPNSGCLIWLGGITSGGYGSCYAEKRYWRAHRLAWTLINGPVPLGLEVCHKCDVRLCINPLHLFVGTKSDNMRDMVAKGRGYQPPMQGERNTNARLTREIVECIRRDRAFMSERALARKYNITHSNIHLVCSRKTWA